MSMFREILKKLTPILCQFFNSLKFNSSYLLNISARKEYFRYERTFCVLRYRDKCEFTKIVFAD